MPSTFFSELPMNLHINLLDSVSNVSSSVIILQENIAVPNAGDEISQVFLLLNDQRPAMQVDNINSFECYILRKLL